MYILNVQIFHIMQLQKILSGMSNSLNIPFFQKLLELGGYLAKTSIEATHLVMGIGTAQRTVKFMCAISCCKYVLTLQWILDSHAEAKFLRKYHILYSMGVDGN